MSEEFKKIVMFIPGEPKGKGRPRIVRGHARPFTPAETRKAEERIVEAWRIAGEPRIPDTADYFNGSDATKVAVPIKATVTLLVQRKDNHFLSGGGMNSEGKRHPQPDNRKPDVDNAAKLVMDALNKKAYKDDVRVVTLEVKRRWSKTRLGTHIVIEPEFEIGDWD